MATGSTVRGKTVSFLVIDDLALIREHLPHGQVYQWTKRYAEETVVVARSLLVPGHGVRTGELWNSIHQNTVTRAPKLVEARVVAGGPLAPYAKFVHEGTGPLIFPRSATHLVFRDTRIGAGGEFRVGKRYRLPFVRGQSSNPFLREAARIVRARHNL